MSERECPICESDDVSLYEDDPLEWFCNECNFEWTEKVKEEEKEDAPPIQELEGKGEDDG